MTSINIMKLDYHSGLCICDEARYWNPEWMIFFTPEKIRSVSIPRIRNEQELVLFLGTTGTSSIGDEIIDQTEKAITARYDEACKLHEGMPPRFLTVEEAAAVSFEVATRIKKVHVDDMLRGEFGFNALEYIGGNYQRQEKSYEITNTDVVDKAYRYMTFEDMPGQVKGIYGNSQVFAGYHPAEGFRIFYMTMRMPVCEEVQEIFLAQGSGRDTCDLVYCDFANSQSRYERRERIDRVEATIALFKGLNNAFRLTAGVLGYPKLIYINGHQERPEDRVKEIFDKRSKLGAEIVAAFMEDLINHDATYHLIDQLIFEDKAFHEVNQKFFEATHDRYRLFRFLRGFAFSEKV